MAGFRETPEVCGAVKRLLRAVGYRIAEGAIPEELAELVAVETQLEVTFKAAVDGLRALGFSDTEIGRALVRPDRPNGITKQAVAQRWPHA